MTDTTYNGWANHATWQAMLFLRGDYGSDGTVPLQYADVPSAVLASADALRDYVVDLLTPDTSRNYGRTRDATGIGLYRMDLVRNALDEVDWEECRLALLEE